MAGRRCESCGGMMPPRMHRETRPSDGALVCPSCLMSEVSPRLLSAASVVLDEAELAELRERMAAAQCSIVAARPLRLARTTRYRMTPEELTEHLRVGHGWTPEAIGETHPGDLHGNHVALHELADMGELAQPRHRHVSLQAVESLKATAHESSDDLETMHCPWCGSGQIIGQSDGTISCAYCDRTYTVRLQPTYPAMPQTVEGQPFPPGQPGADAGMPGDEVPGELPAGMEGAEQMPPDGLPPDGAPADDADEDEGDDDLPAFMKGSTLRTAAGTELPGDAYLRHLALVESGYAEPVLEQVRAAAGRSPSGTP